MINQLLEMKSAAKSNIQLYSFHWATRAHWTCVFEIESDALKLKLSKDGPTPEAAVAACHEAWTTVYRSGVKDAAPSLLMSPASYHHEDDADALWNS